MKRSILLSVLALALLQQTSAAQGHWPQWRGPLGTGEAPDANPPVSWSEDENVRWKVPLPGRGNGTPIIWGEHVFVLTAEPTGEEVAVAEPEPEPEGGGRGRRGGRRRGVQPTRTQRFEVIAMKRADGSEAWRSVAIEALPHEGTHSDGTWASSSAVTDGEHLFAYFGSRGLHAYDMKGEKLWEKQFGEMKTRNSFGEGSSPALHGDTIVVQWDHEGPSFIVALDAASGEEKWRRERDEPTSWATPMIVEVDGKMQVVTNGTQVRSYDLESGEIVWECGPMTLNAVPTPVHAQGEAYLMSGFRGNALFAIPLAGAKGDVAASENGVRWSSDKDTPYVPSPVLTDGRLYFLKSNSGIMTCFDVEKGESLYGPERLATVSNVYASPVAAAGRVYFVGRDGETDVLENGGGFQVLATNRLDDAFDASPALAEGELYLRGASALYCIANGDG